MRSPRRRIGDRELQDQDRSIKSSLKCRIRNVKRRIRNRNCSGIETYKTSIVAVKFQSSIVFVIDSRMSLIDYSDVGSNMSQKIIQINSDAVLENDMRYAFVAFSGDTPLLRKLKKTLPDDPVLKANLTISVLTDRIIEEVKPKIRREMVFYGIVIIGIGAGDTLQMDLVSTVQWTWEEKENNPASKKSAMKLVVERNVEDVCVAGTGAKFLQTFFKDNFFTGPNWDGVNSFKMGRKVLNIPLVMEREDAKKLTMDAMEYTVHRNVGTGGVLHGFHFIKSPNINDKYGGFRIYPFYRVLKDYYHCKGMHFDWPDPKNPPVFDEDD